MADGKQFASHPNENLLSAFAEHMLTEKERLSVLEHLSICTHCRDVVFLAQQALSETAELKEGTLSPAPAVRSRVWWWSLAASGALAALLIAVPIAVYRTRGHSSEVVPREMASKSKVLAPPSPRPMPSAGSAVQMAQPPVKKLTKKMPSAPDLNGRTEGQVELAGSVADQSGAVIAGAQVTVRSPATGAARTAVADAQGRFDIAALRPGEYQVEISALGFNTLRQPLTVQQRQSESLDAKLDVGAASESVTVSAGSIGGLATDSTTVNGKISEQHKAVLPANGRSAAPAVMAPTSPAPQATGEPTPSAQVMNAASPNTTYPVEDGIVQRCVASECVARNLPSDAKAVSAAASMRTVIALDADGNVFLSGDQGEHWEQAKVQWLGKAVGVALRPTQSMSFLPSGNPSAGTTHGIVARKTAPSPVLPATFELTNDKSQVWISTDDGKTWVVK